MEKRVVQIEKWTGGGKSTLIYTVPGTVPTESTVLVLYSITVRNHYPYYSTSTSTRGQILQK